MRPDNIEITEYSYSKGFAVRGIGIRVKCKKTGISFKCNATRSDHKNLAICFQYINAARS